MSSSSTEPGAQTLVEVTMPAMGVSVSEGTIVEWTKQPGDAIAYEETICLISTDKIDTDLPAPAAGHVAELLVDVGATVDVGTVLATIATDGGSGAAPAGRRWRWRGGGRAGRDARAGHGEARAEAGRRGEGQRRGDREGGSRRAPLLAGRLADRGRARRRPRAGHGHRARRARAQAGRPGRRRGLGRRGRRPAAAHRVALPARSRAGGGRRGGTERRRGTGAHRGLDRGPVAHAPVDRRAHEALAGDGRDLHHLDGGRLLAHRGGARSGSA